MTSLVRATSPDQFLTVVPRLLGFVPRQSIVLVPFRRGRSRGAMRLDLPASDDRVDEIAATMIGLVCRVPEADACAVVVYGDADAARPLLVEGLLARADACGIRVIEALWVCGTRWGVYGDPAETAAPSPQQLPPPERADDEVIAGDQYSGAALDPCDPARAAAISRAAAAFADAARLVAQGDDAAPSGPLRVDPRALSAVCLLDDLPAFVERMLHADPDAADPFEIAVLGWVLARPALRDIALICWVDGVDAGDDAAEAQLRWEEGEDYPAEIAMRLWGEGARPSPARLEHALALTRAVAAGLPEQDRPGPLAVCGWLSWALGRSTHAEVYAEAAVAGEPEHGLAEIVRSFVHAGHLPDWAFRLGDPETAEPR